MDNIKDLLKENKLTLSTLVVFTRAENAIHKHRISKQLRKVA